MSIDFSTTPQGELPKGFRPLLAGEGSPGRWEVILAEVPPTLAPLSPKAPQTSVKPVLTQTVHDPTDERFPMLVYEGEEFTDFTLTARLRLLGGVQEQMAGMAFRLQDAQNFYVIRLSALGQNLRFYKVVQGTRGRPIGPSIPISTNTWHELKIECQGNQILCTLNGQLVMPALQDTSFARGRIAFWTKSDSLCQFAGVSVVYTPTTPLSVQMIEAALAKYPRVIDLRLYAPQTGSNTIRAVACKNPPDLGTPGGKAEVGAIRNADIYVGKGKQTVTVVMPVRDRNGEPAAAAQIVMDSFAGQTENNAIVRARPIVRLMETMLQSSQDPLR
ncbi:MAG: DUF1080 domain-containing protein [Verrucomicrobia bacterium]|nr:DUF1080 domain-containing protein [Verrucomicrobiota bacterium]